MLTQADSCFILPLQDEREPAAALGASALPRPVRRGAALRLSGKCSAHFFITFRHFLETWVEGREGVGDTKRQTPSVKTPGRPAAVPAGAGTPAAAAASARVYK